MVVRGYRLGGAGLLRLLVGGKIDRRTRPYRFYVIFYHQLYPKFYQTCRGGFTQIFDTHRQIM